MKIVCISDTHNRHEEIEDAIPDGDVIIHAGDATNKGTEKEAYKFIKWFSGLPHKHKIFVPGNHDFFFESNPPISDFSVLINQSLVIDGVKFYGTPAQPVFFNWAFNFYEPKLKIYYDNIDKDTDVLITHCPPYGTLDKVNKSKGLGSKVLNKAIKNLNIKYHVFGHIHDSAGRKGNSINASCLNEKYEPNDLDINFFEV